MVRLTNLLKGIPAAVGEVDGTAAVGHCLAQPAQRHLQLAEVAGTDGGVHPVLFFDAAIHTLPHRLDGFGEASQSAQAEGGLVEQPGLVRRAEVRRRPAPRLLEERRHRPQVRADRPELERAVVAAGAGAAQDAVEIDLIARLLVSPSEAAVGDGLVEGLEAGEGVGPIRRGRAQVIEQPRMRGAERLGPLVAELPGEVLADQRVGVDGQGLAVVGVRRAA